MHNRVSRIALASAALLALGTQSGFAIEADDFGSKIVATAKLMGVAVSYDGASVEGDTVTLSNFTIAVPDEDDVDLPGDLVFAGVVEVGDGSYTAESASIDDIAIEDDDLSLAFENIVAENLVIPAEPTIENAFEISFSLYEQVSAGPLTVSIDDAEVFAIDSMRMWIENEEADGGVGTGYEISGIRGDLSGIEDAEAREMIEAFGTEQLSGAISGYGVWYPETGRASIDEMDFVFDDLGTLSMNFAVTGYTREFYDESIKMNAKMAELAAAGEEISEEQTDAMEQAMLDQLAGLQLESATIRYDDASLFMKVLDIIAAEQGVDGATLANGLKFMVPMILTEIQNPEFSSMVTEAVNAFVDDPQNFEISAEPDSPVGAEAFMAAEEDPFVLIDLLNVQVRANQ